MRHCVVKNIEVKPGFFARIAFKIYGRKFGNRNIHWNSLMLHPPSHPDSREGCYYCVTCNKRWNAAEEELMVFPFNPQALPSAILEFDG